LLLLKSLLNIIEWILFLFHLLLLKLLRFWHFFRLILFCLGLDLNLRDCSVCYLLWFYLVKTCFRGWTLTNGNLHLKYLILQLCVFKRFIFFNLHLHYFWLKHQKLIRLFLISLIKEHLTNMIEKIEKRKNCLSC